jgi:hypothetical protein
MPAKKRKKIFDVDRKIDKPIILEEKMGSEKEAEMRVLARKEELKKTPLGKKYVKWYSGLPKRKYIKVKGNQILLEDQYIKTGWITLKLRPLGGKTKLLIISSFYPKDTLEATGHKIKREGIGTAAVKRIREIATSITKKGEKTYIECGTAEPYLQNIFDKLGFKPLYEGTVHTHYRLIIDKTKKEKKK